MIHKSNYKLVILNRSYFFFLFKVFHPFKTFIYDIRSGIVKPIAWKRKLFTLILKWDILFFKNITIISDSLAKKLKIKRYQVLPLGAEAFNLPPKKFNEIQLMYVGTLNNRRIEETIDGFSQFLQKVPENNNIFYHIYGFGTLDAEEKITSYIENLHLENKVFFHGKISPTDLRDKLRIHNLGVSYIPITPYFDVQPPTKTFEYLLAGMPVIATNTSENARVITEENGVLIPDSPEGFKTGLQAIYSKIIQNHYSSDVIYHNSRFFSWEYIVSNIFKPYIDDLITN